MAPVNKCKAGFFCSGLSLFLFGVFCCPWAGVKTLTHCLLGWVGPRTPIYLLWLVLRSRGCPALGQGGRDQFSVAGVSSNPASPTQHDEAQRIEVKCRVLVSGRSATRIHPSFSSPCRALTRRSTQGCALKPPCRCWALEDKESWCCRTAC